MNERRHMLNEIAWWLQLQKIPRYRIHSSKRPGGLKKSFRVGPYLFQYLLQLGSTQNFMILAIFWLIPNHLELSMLVS